MIEYSLYGLSILAMIFSIWAQIKVSSTFRKYSSVRTRSGMYAAQVAENVLHNAGIYNVKVERIGGSLTDHFDPRTNTLRLSDSVYGSDSAAAIGVAAHEAGHAIQHAVGYNPIKIRASLVPAVNFASKFTWILIFLGALLMGFSGDTGLGYNVMLFGVILFAVVALFQLVTLPVEFNASRRAMAALRDSGRYTADELTASRRVLTAAALTYVAALAVSLVQLLRLVISLSNSRDRRR